MTNFYTPMRFVLALVVALEHIAYLQANTPDSPFEIGHMAPAYLAVNGFFIISGFLITGSAERSRSVVNFFRSRALRILPALTVAGLLMTLVLGALMTDMALGAYLMNPQTWGFTLQLVSFIDPYPPLPGVSIEGSFWPKDITGPIWTLRYEALAYIGTGTLLLFGLHRNKPIAVAAIALSTLLFAVDLHTGSITSFNATLGSLMRFGFCYLIGVLFYLLPEARLPKGWKDAGFGLALCLAGCLLISFGIPSAEVLVNVGLAVLIFIVAYMPVSAPRWITHPPDISYGLYIFHWPIYQFLYSEVSAPPNALLMLFVGLPLAMIMATASWYLVEKPALRFKGKGAIKPETAPAPMA